MGELLVSGRVSLGEVGCYFSYIRNHWDVPTLKSEGRKTTSSSLVRSCDTFASEALKIHPSGKETER